MDGIGCITPSDVNVAPKTLLLVAYDIPPLGVAGVHRNLAIVKHFASTGWNVVVLTVKIDQKIFSTYDWSLMNSIPQSAIIVRTDLIEPYDNYFYRIIMGARKKFTQDRVVSGVSNTPTSSIKIRKIVGNFLHSCMVPDRFMGWIPYAIKSGIGIFKKYRPDVIISESPTIACHIVGYYLSRRFKIPWILDFHDPWTTYAFALKRMFPLNNIEKYFEKKFLMTGDRIITTAESLQEEFQTMYPDINKEKYHVIYNGYDDALFSSLKPKVFDKFTIVFTGMTYDVPVHHDFFSGIKIAIAKEPRLLKLMQVFFIGNTFQGFNDLIHQYDLGSIVHCLGYHKHESCIQHLLGAHAAYYYIYNYNQISCKLFEYLRSGTLIFAILPPGHEVGKIINNTSSGLICPLNDPSLVADNLLRIFDRYLNSNSSMHGSHNSAIERFERYTQIKEISKIADGLIA